MRRQIILPMAILTIFFFITSCNQSAEDSTAGTDIKIATNFTLDSLTENKQISLEDFRGKGVVLNFWASWCGPCKEEMPLFEETWKKYQDKDVVFLGIDVMDDKSNAEEFLKSVGISYPNLYDPQGRVSNKYKVIALPATFFIDKDGNIIGKNYGPFLGRDGKKVLMSYIEEIAN